MAKLSLPPHLFWDNELSSIDFQKHSRFVIQRVIEKGSVANWKAIKDFYGLELIRQEILKMRSLDKKTLNFFSTYFEIDKTEFRCYSTKQSTPEHYNF